MANLGNTEDYVRWYDYYVFSKEGSLSKVISMVVTIMDHYEGVNQTRLRARRSADRSSFLRCIESVVCNLAYAIIIDSEDQSVLVSRSKRDGSYNTNPRLPQKTLISVLDVLQACGLIEQNIGTRRKNTTTIEAMHALRDMIRHHRVDFSCFRRCSTAPLLVLRRTVKEHPARKARKEPVPFQSTLETDEMVAQVTRLNTFLASADIDFIDDHHPTQGRVDTSRRTVTRYFTILPGQSQRFDQGGRLFGPGQFWLGLKSERRGNLRIDGEPVADLDFKNLGPRLAYAMLGQEPPEGDLYDLTGLLPGYIHDNPEHRKGIKRAMASCFNGGSAGSREGILDKLPKGTKAEAVREAVLAKHPAFRELFERKGVPVGYEIMFVESRILLCALERLMAEGVTALPFHDGLMCAASKAEIAIEALGEASVDIMGAGLPVELKALYGLPSGSEDLLAA